MHRIQLAPALAVTLLSGAACAAPTGQPLSRADRALVALDLAHTRSAGVGPSFRPPASTPAVAAGASVAGWRCARRRETTYGAHIELFAEQHEVVVPGGIGVSHPRLSRSLVTAGRCFYPLRTNDPTGVIRVELPRGRPVPRLGELFALWGQPLTLNRLGAFTGTVTAFLDGRQWMRAPGAIPLRRHAQIVLEVGGFVAPHTAYGFPPGL